MPSSCQTTGGRGPPVHGRRVGGHHVGGHHVGGAPTGASREHHEPVGKTFPGFMIPSGSKTALRRRWRAISAAPSSSPSHGTLTVPTPCSPVIVPPSERPS